MEYIDEQRIQNDIHDGTRKHGDHSVSGKSLRVDETVHSGGNHGKCRAKQINLQIAVGVGVGGFGCAEEKQNRPPEQITEDKQNQRGNG